MGRGTPVHRSKRRGKNGKVPGRVKGGSPAGIRMGPPAPSPGWSLMETIRRRRQVAPLRWLRRQARKRREQEQEAEA